MRTSRSKDEGPRDWILDHLEAAVIELRAAAAWSREEGYRQIEDDCNEAAATAEKHYYAVKKIKA